MDSIGEKGMNDQSQQKTQYIKSFWVKGKEDEEQERGVMGKKVRGVKGSRWPRV